MIGPLIRNKANLPRRIVRIGALLAAMLPLAALADSTTNTSLTITGKPMPGKQVVANVVVTGKHLVYGPPISVPGGNIQISVNGTIVLALQATGGVNSNVIDWGCVRPTPAGCEITKYISNNTTIAAPITLPKGVSQYTISAKYTGDDDSHASTSPSVVLKPVYTNIGAAVNLLLND